MAISLFGVEFAEINCSGLKRENKFETVIVTNGYAIVDWDIIGGYLTATRFKRDRSEASSCQWSSAATPVRPIGCRVQLAEIRYRPGTWVTD